MMDALTIGLWLVGQLVVGAAIWGGIRSEISSIHKNQEAFRAELTEQRARMDRHMESTGLHTRVPE